MGRIADLCIQFVWTDQVRQLPPPNPELLDAVMCILIDLHESGWKAETCKDYSAPIVRLGAGGSSEGLPVTYAMAPRNRIAAAFGRLTR